MMLALKIVIQIYSITSHPVRYNVYALIVLFILMMFVDLDNGILFAGVLTGTGYMAYELELSLNSHKLNVIFSHLLSLLWNDILGAALPLS